MADTLLDAYFTDNERTTVLALWADDDAQVTEQYIDAKADNAAYKKVLEQMDIDTLHERTYKHIREQVEALEDDIIRAAKSRGLIHDLDDINSNLYKLIIESIFQEFNPEEQKERLFMLKIALFEVERIRASKKRKLKAELRKASSIVEAVHLATGIILAEEDTSATNQTEASPPVSDSSNTQGNRETPAEQSDTSRNHTSDEGD